MDKTILINDELGFGLYNPKRFLDFMKNLPNTEEIATIGGGKDQWPHKVWFNDEYSVAIYWIKRHERVCTFIPGTNIYRKESTAHTLIEIYGKPENRKNFEKIVLEEVKKYNQIDDK